MEAFADFTALAIRVDLRLHQFRREAAARSAAR
jgi:hypothetical protein